MHPVLFQNNIPETGKGKSGNAGVKGGVTGDIILEQDGVHYIDRRVMTPDRETVKKLDQDFLSLVNSVLK